MTEREFIDNGEMFAPFNGKLMAYDANLRSYAVLTENENYQRLFTKAWNEFCENGKLDELKKDYAQLLEDMRYVYTAGFSAAWSRFKKDFVAYMQCSPVERCQRKDFNEQKYVEMEEDRMEFQNKLGKNFLDEVPAETVPVFIDIWNSAYAECTRQTLPFYQSMEHLLNNIDEFYPGKF